jgi:hypothetical protein
VEEGVLLGVISFEGSLCYLGPLSSSLALECVFWGCLGVYGVWRKRVPLT